MEHLFMLLARKDTLMWSNTPAFWLYIKLGTGKKAKYYPCCYHACIYSSENSSPQIVILYLYSLANNTVRILPRPSDHPLKPHTDSEKGILSMYDVILLLCKTKGTKM